MGNGEHVISCVICVIFRGFFSQRIGTCTYIPHHIPQPPLVKQVRESKFSIQCKMVGVVRALNCARIRNV